MWLVQLKVDILKNSNQFTDYVLHYNRLIGMLEIKTIKIPMIYG